MSEYITLGLGILLSVFIFFGIFWGLIRGLKKTVSRGLFLLVICIILIFVSGPVTRALLNIPVNATIELDGEVLLSGSNPIYDIISAYIQGFLDKDFVANNPEIVDIMTALPIVAINSIIYLILFWLLKILLLPLNAIINHFVFVRKDKREALGFAGINDDDDFLFDPLLEENKNKSNKESLTDSSTKSIEEEILDEIDISKNTQSNIQVKETTTSIQSEDIQLNAEINYENTDYSQISPLNTSNSSTDENEQLSKVIEENEEVVEENTQIIEDEKIFTQENKLNENTTTEITEQKTVEIKPVEVIQIAEPSKKKEKKKKKVKVKVPKRRLLGGLVGAFVGLIVAFNTMIPVFGITNILTVADKYKINNLSEEEISLSKLSGGITDDILKGYNTSAMHYVTKYTGLEALGIAGFDRVTTQKINDKKITLSNEVENILETVSDVDLLIGKYNSYATDGNLSSITQAELDELLLLTKNVIKQSREIQILDCLADYMVPLACTYLIKSEIDITDNPTINRMIIETMQTLLDSAGINLYDELMGILDIVDYVNEQKLLIHIIQNDYENPIQIIQNLDDDFSDKLITKVLNLKIVDTTISHIMNIGITFLNSALDIDSDESNTTKEEVISTTKNFINKTFNVLKTLEDSDIYVNANTLVPLGDLIDTIKDNPVINEETYNSLVDYLIKQIKPYISESLPEDFAALINNQILSNIKKVESWSFEMMHFRNAINILRDKEVGIIGSVEENVELRQGLTIDFRLEENVLNNIGVALDELECTTLFGTVYEDSVFIDGVESSTLYKKTPTSELLALLIQEVSENLEDSSESISDVFMDMCVSLRTSNHIHRQESDFFEKELRALSPLVIELSNISSDNTPSFEKIGECLDKARTRTILNSDNVISLVDALVTTIKDTLTISTDKITLDNVINEFLLDIQTNLNKEDIKQASITNPNFWENELAYVDETIEYIEDIETSEENILQLKTSNESNDELADLGVLLDKLDKTILFGTPNNISFNSSTYSITPIGKLLANSLDLVKDSAKESIDSKYLDLLNIFDDIKSNLITSEYFENDHIKDNFYSNEIEYIEPLIEYITNLTDSSSFNITNQLGVELDNTRARSTLIDDNVTIQFASNAMNILKDETLGNDYIYTSTPSDQDINDKLYELFSEISSILSNPNTLTECESNENFWTEEINGYLALMNMSEDIDTISVDNISTISDKLDEAYVCYTISKQQINNLIAFALRDSKSSNNTGMDKGINDLIETIATNLENLLSDSEKTLTDFWHIELGYIESLSTMNFDTLDNLAETGAILDDITVGTHTTSGTTRASYLIYHNDIRTLLATSMTDVKSNITSDVTNTTIKDALEHAIDSITANILDTTNIPTLSFETELNYLQTLSDIDISGDLFEDKDGLVSVGEKLDSISYNTIDNNISTEYSSDNSLLITRNILTTLILEIIPLAKTDNDTKINAIIDGTTEENSILYNEDISSKLKAIRSKDYIVSWAEEFEFIAKLQELKDLTTITDDNYITLGQLLDGLAFNIVDKGLYYIFDDNTFENDGTRTYLGSNSMLISRSALNYTIASSVAELDVSDDKIATHLSTISSSILDNNDNIISWEHELGKINELTHLNDGVEDNLSDDEKLVILGKNIDLIAFNYTLTYSVDDEVVYLNNPHYNDTSIKTVNDIKQITFPSISQTASYNSVIISREILNNIIKDFMQEFKVENAESGSKDEIINELIDNSTAKINITKEIDTSTYHSGYITKGYTIPGSDNVFIGGSFSELIAVKEVINDLVDNLSDVEIKNINDETATYVDSSLETLQSALVCGNITTRKLTILILKNIRTTMINTLIDSGLPSADATNGFDTKTEAGKYINNLINYYNANNASLNASSISEEYSVTAGNETSEYFNPFVTLANKSTEITL